MATVTAKDAAGTAPPPARQRPLASIDLLKAFAIFGVLWQHTVPRAVTDDVMGNLWIRPAVPIFFVLLGLNLAGSLGRSALDPDRLRSYLSRRLRRVAMPFLLVLAIAYVIAIVRGPLDPTPAWLLGGMPVNAPGNYFIPALFGVILMMPAIVWAYRRRPVATVVACIALNVAFELFAAWSRGAGSGIFGTGSTLYQGAPLRYLALVAFGVWLATDHRLGARRNAPLLVLAAASAGYLVAEQLRPDLFSSLPPGFLRTTNYLAAPWAVLLVMLGLRFLPVDRPRSPLGRAAVGIGRASYHIYLVQMLWIGGAVVSIWGARLAHTGTALAIAPTSMLTAIALGWIYFRLVPGRRA